MADKVDSNITGLRIAEEYPDFIGTDADNPYWIPLDPNGYNDFGGQLTLLARNPINASRQRKKGVITDLDASGGFGQDFTKTNSFRLLQGYFFADVEELPTTRSVNYNPLEPTTFTAVTDVTSGTLTFTLAAAAPGGPTGTPFNVAGTLVRTEGFENASNDGIGVVASATATSIVLSAYSGTLVSDATPGTDARIYAIGHEFASGEVGLRFTPGLPYAELWRVSGTFDFTTLGLTPGEWIFIGGDTAGTAFTQSQNNGFARVHGVTADSIQLDKISIQPIFTNGGGKTIRIFRGNILRNQKNPALVKRRTYQLERTLGSDLVGRQSEILVGAVPSEFSMQIRQADKITADFSFMATDNQQRTGTDGLKAGARPDPVDAPAYNTSSDFSRIRLSLPSTTTIPPYEAALFAYMTEMTININNNTTPNKAVAVLGAFDISAGTFQVGGSITAYFADVTAVQAVRNNADVTLDWAIVKDNAGFVWDVPLLGLGDGRLSVEQDQPITLPLTVEAAESANGYTLSVTEFPYLPTLAG